MTEVAEQVGLVAFSLSAVLVLRDHEVDIVGIIALGVVTGVGGGTVRDLLLEEQVFWISEPSNLVVPAVASVIGFALVGLVARAQRLVELLDGLGLAVFSVAGSSLALEVGARPAIAVILGVITATAGGALRDVLADRPTLLIGHGLYVTPALVGAGLFVGLVELDVSTGVAAGVGAVVALAIRVAAIVLDLSMPGWLTLRHARTEVDADG